MNRFTFWPVLVLCLAARPTLAQPAAARQDSTLDNLVHEAGYQTGELGALGAVVERGRGPIPMVLISGFGVGASVFDGFMARNAARYHMFAITLPGFEGTAAPPMPPTGTSYGAQTWTRAAIDAVVRLIQDRGLQRPVLVGHFLNGTQVAAQVAIAHPELARALVLLAGTPRYEPVTPTPSWPKGMTREQKVMAVDRGLAPRWFKTVTRQTWVAGNFVASDYSVDDVRGRQYTDLANQPPLPVLIRYLCEFHASDLTSDLAQLQPPLLVLQPSFTAALRADPTRVYLSSFFTEPWQGLFTDRPHTERLRVEDAGILVMDDQPAAVDQAIAGFLARHVP